MGFYCVNGRESWVNDYYIKVGIEVSPILSAKVSKYRALHMADTFENANQMPGGTECLKL